MNETPYQAEVEELTWGWGLVLLVGLLSIAAGVIVLLLNGIGMTALGWGMRGLRREVAGPA
jgi:uncharacterized membrane protein HdeD (DUF308 family)